MSSAIVQKDLKLFGREALVKGLLIVTLALVVVSVLTGLQRERVFEKEKTAALDTDLAVWMQQGDRNPHSAAHFSRYAFRPASPLAIVDPGTTDFAGLAIWMEAHYQDPAAFRRAEDGGELSRYAQLTPAFLVLTVGPMVVFLMLFASIAGEREDGTLRQLLASGVDARTFFFGKLAAGLRLTLIAYTVVFVPAAIISVIASPGHAGAEAMLRLILLYAAYGVYLGVSVAVAIGVSALFRSRQSAFLALTSVWVLFAIILPSLAADIGTTLYPQPDARAASAELRAASSLYYRDPELQAEVEQAALDEYGVATVEELPIDYGAYTLQVSEELSEPAFDRFYASLDERYAAQESVARWFSLLTPAIAATSLSSGIAGTDRIHQRDFAIAAEAHRRKMIKLLNEDYMFNAGDAGYGYTANAELWAKFEGLDYDVPTLGKLAGAYVIDGLILVAWLVAAMLLAFQLVKKAVRHEVST